SIPLPPRKGDHKAFDRHPGFQPVRNRLTVLFRPGTTGEIRSFVPSPFRLSLKSNHDPVGHLSRSKLDNYSREDPSDFVNGRPNNGSDIVQDLIFPMNWWVREPIFSN